MPMPIGTRIRPPAAVIAVQTSVGTGRPLTKAMTGSSKPTAPSSLTTTARITNAIAQRSPDPRPRIVPQAGRSIGHTPKASAGGSSATAGPMPSVLGSGSQRPDYFVTLKDTLLV